MSYAFLFVRKHGINIYIFHTVEDICLHKGIGLLQLGDELLCFQTLGIGFFIIAICRAGFGKVACTLQEAKPVMIPPRQDITLPDVIQGADQLQSFGIIVWI